METNITLCKGLWSNLKELKSTLEHTDHVSLVSHSALSGV